MEVPYVVFPWVDSRALAARLCPSKNLDELHSMLETRSDAIRALPIHSPERQLLAALRRRAPSLRVPFYAERDRVRGLDYWLTLQSGCPLAA